MTAMRQYFRALLPFPSSWEGDSWLGTQATRPEQLLGSTHPTTLPLAFGRCTPALGQGWKYGAVHKAPGAGWALAASHAHP